jgi:hypothetical protein
LFAEGYADKLSGVVFNTNLDGRKNTNTSGLVAIDSTALGRDKAIGKTAPSFYGHCYRVFRALVGRSWKNGKSTGETEDAFAYAYWLMQPVSPQNLGSLLTALERQARDRRGHLLLEWKNKLEIQSYAKEIFMMTHQTWDGNHDAVQKLAKAVASSIKYARQNREDKPGRSQKDIWEAKRKAWYNEAIMLRLAPTPRVFFERALILIEQGRLENSFIGSAKEKEDFNIPELCRSIGDNPRSFEIFRDLFRMYLIQESTPHLGTVRPSTDDSTNADTDSEGESDAPSEQAGDN